MFDVIKHLSVAGRTLNEQEHSDAARLCEVGKAALLEFAHGLVRASHGRPLLYSYVGDGTPLKLRYHFESGVGPHLKVKGSGFTGTELFCQGAFLRNVDEPGAPVVRTILRDPRPMINKGGLASFNAAKEMFPLLHELQHEGYKVHHYSWDGAIYSACSRHMRRYHKMTLQTIRDTHPGYRGTLQVLRSWVLFSGCALHVVHNAFSWGTARYGCGLGMLDDLFVVIESLRNGYKPLQCHVVSFLSAHVVFQADVLARDTLHAFWTALDVEPMLCGMLADRGVMWSGTKIIVSAAYSTDEDLISFLYTACLSVFRFKQFTHSRWLTVGTSMRTLVASCALGLQGLWRWTTSDPAVSMYYLGGFIRLSLPMLRYGVIASIASRASECLALDLLEDDRAVRQICVYEATVQDELNWIARLPTGVWDVLGQLTEAAAGSSNLRSDCLDAAFAASAYVHQNFFSQVRCLPWTLAMGNVEDNVEVLARGGQPTEEVAGKIWELCRLQCNKAELVEAITMLRVPMDDCLGRAASRLWCFHSQAAQTLR